MLGYPDTAMGCSTGATTVVRWNELEAASFAVCQKNAPPRRRSVRGAHVLRLLAKDSEKIGGQGAYWRAVNLAIGASALRLMKDCVS